MDAGFRLYSTATTPAGLADEAAEGLNSGCPWASSRADPNRDPFKCHVMNPNKFLPGRLPGRVVSGAA